MYLHQEVAKKSPQSKELNTNTKFLHSSSFHHHFTFTFLPLLLSFCFFLSSSFIVIFSPSFFLHNCLRGKKKQNSPSSSTSSILNKYYFPVPLLKVILTISGRILFLPFFFLPSFFLQRIFSFCSEYFVPSNIYNNIMVGINKQSSLKMEKERLNFHAVSLFLLSLSLSILSLSLSLISIISRFFHSHSLRDFSTQVYYIVLHSIALYCIVVMQGNIFWFFSFLISSPPFYPDCSLSLSLSWFFSLFFFMVSLVIEVKK